VTSATNRIIVGRGGLLGGALARRLGLVSGRTGVDWDDPALAVEQVAALTSVLGRSSGTCWWALWCAGGGYVGADVRRLREETTHLAAFLDGLRAEAERGILFFSSSAGGVHGSGALSTELSTPDPISDYGREKLHQERLVRDWCEATGGRAVVGRISNLYGPGQNLTKPQGLVSRLVRAALLSEPLTVYVSLDTSRDYLFTADAAALVEAAMLRAESELSPGEAALKLITSGCLTTIGALVAELGRIRKKRPPIVFAQNPTTAMQPRVLAFRSVVWPDLDLTSKTPLAVGIDAVLRDQARILAGGGLR
jgi:nucleoside-diphosphate-sugar epimerase